LPHHLAYGQAAEPSPVRKQQNTVLQPLLLPATLRRHTQSNCAAAAARSCPARSRGPNLKSQCCRFHPGNRRQQCCSCYCCLASSRGTHPKEQRCSRCCCHALGMYQKYWCCSCYCRPARSGGTNPKFKYAARASHLVT
jgi:hypothetical protein